MPTLKSLSFFFIYLLTLIFYSQVESLDIERYRQEALAQHNFYRAQCNTPYLQRNTTLEQIAQRWCDQLSITNQFNHSGTIEYGENSYKKTPFDYSVDNGTTPVMAWYSERPKYSEADPSNALHFTQVMWANTKYLGIGICQIINGGLLFVANYYPRGNYQHQFGQNILCPAST